VRLNSLVIQAVKLVPDVLPYLMDRARFIYFGAMRADAYKSYDDMLSKIQVLVQDTYKGKVSANVRDG